MDHRSTLDVPQHPQPLEQEHDDHKLSKKKEIKKSSNLELADQFNFEFDHSAHTNGGHHETHVHPEAHFQIPTVKHLKHSIQETFSHAADASIKGLRRLHKNPKTHYAFDFIAISILVGVIAAVALSHGVLATIVLAILPTLCVGIWIAFRVPQKVDLKALTEASTPPTQQLSSISQVQNESPPPDSFLDICRRAYAKVYHQTYKDAMHHAPGIAL